MVGTDLEDRGVTFFGGYAVEIWGNTSGGLEQGTVYTGLLDFDLTHDAAQLAFDESARRVGYEIVLEATYDIEVTPWLHVQPDAQYIIRPGTTGDLDNAFFLGGRASIIF